MFLFWFYFFLEIEICYFSLELYNFRIAKWINCCLCVESWIEKLRVGELMNDTWRYLPQDFLITIFLKCNNLIPKFWIKKKHGELCFLIFSFIHIQERYKRMSCTRGECHTRGWSRFLTYLRMHKLRGRVPRSRTGAQLKPLSSSWWGR